MKKHTKKSLAKKKLFEKIVKKADQLHILITRWKKLYLKKKHALAPPKKTKRIKPLSWND